MSSTGTKAFTPAVSSSRARRRAVPLRFLARAVLRREAVLTGTQVHRSTWRALIFDVNITDAEDVAQILRHRI